MTLRPGTRLGSYEVTSLLGSGGMGEVYRAKDHKLGRDVAIKVLQEELASDPERLRRFEQEARSASALNHPNIVTIHDIRLRQGYGGQVGKTEDVDFIVMEFVEGKTLREVLSEGPLPTKKLLQLATQIAEGLAKAHSGGIAHRDLKPENLMVTSDGYVKILDFGLAKLFTPPTDAGSELATMEKAGTTPGMVMGTAGYMSPEQAKGLAVDYRADQFAFGAILYEMVTGKRAFQRETGAETISAVLRDEPKPLADTHPDLPPHLRVIVERCLAKDAEERFTATLDLAKDLKSMGEPSTVSAEKPHPRSRLLATAGFLVAVLAVMIGLSVSGQWDRSPEAPSPRIDSLVVLPLDNLSGDPDQEYFADGMTEVLTSDLAKISAIKVISRTSAMRYKGTDKALPEIARELNVDGVVEGSVMRAGDRVRITAQLIEAATDQHVWSESYERDLRQVLTLQSEVARAIAREIEVRLTAQEESLLTGARPVNPEAHDAYLTGLYHWNKRSREGHRKALEYFQRAIETDPDYAPAYSGLAGCYETFGDWSYAAPREVMPKAKAAALKAIELDGTLADSHATLGEINLHFDWNWSAAEREAKRAIELNPNHARAHVVYSFYLTIHGQGDEAFLEARRAQELDPLNLVTNYALGFVLAESRQLEEAIDQFQKTLELESSFAPPYEALFEAYYLKGMHQESLAARRIHDDLWGFPEVVAAMDQGQDRSGFKKAMAQGAQTLIELKRSNTDYVSPRDIALLCLLAEDRNQSLDWLEQSYEERDPWLPYINGPIWDPIRSDPRFQDIVHRMNFPE